jgi:hypothetical protein
MQNLPKVTLPEDQHPVGEFCSDGSYKPLGVAVRSRAAWRDLQHADACVGQYRIERGGELAGSIPNEELELSSPLAELTDEVAGFVVWSMHRPDSWSRR